MKGWKVPVLFQEPRTGVQMGFLTLIQEKKKVCMMRRLIVFLLALVFCFGAATAESAVSLEFKQLPVQSEQGNSYAYFPNYRYETLVRVASGEGKNLVNLEGEPISDTYQEIINSDRVCRVYDGDHWGVISAQTGEVLVPCLYDQTESVSFLYGENDGSWNLGIYLEDGTVSDHDYRDSNDDRKYYRITSSDLYHGTEKITSFTREQYSTVSSISLQGKYIWLCANFNADRTYDIYDLDFNLLKSGVNSVREYEEDFSTSTVIHVPTGQAAFTEGCTLTQEDVLQPYRYVQEEKGRIIGLNGQVVCAPEQEYSYINISGKPNGYFMVEKDGLYGLIDQQGKEIIPCICQELPSGGFFEEGYVPAAVNGKLVFFDAAGTMTDPGISADQATMISNVFGYTEGEDGQFRIISAAVGILEGDYGCPDIAVGKLLFLSNREGHYGAIDANGNVILPFDGSWEGFSTFAQDRVLLARDASYNYQIASLPQD